MATNPYDIYNLTYCEKCDYDIKQGFGNLSLFRTPYPYTRLTSRELVDCIREANENFVQNTLFFIDEAEEVYHPRNYTSKEQTANLKGIGQHAKMDNIYIYTFQRGKPEDVLLGVDKMLRANTKIDIEIQYYFEEQDFLIYDITNYMFKGLDKPIPGILDGLRSYYPNWNTLEPVV